MDNIKNHDPNSPILIGKIMDDDIISIAKQQSWKTLKAEQLSLL